MNLFPSLPGGLACDRVLSGFHFRSPADVWDLCILGFPWQWLDSPVLWAGREQQARPAGAKPPENTREVRPRLRTSSPACLAAAGSRPPPFQKPQAPAGAEIPRFLCSAKHAHHLLSWESPPFTVFGGAGPGKGQRDLSPGALALQPPHPPWHQGHCPPASCWTIPSPSLQH